MRDEVWVGVAYAQGPGYQGFIQNLSPIVAFGRVTCREGGCGPRWV